MATPSPGPLRDPRLWTAVVALGFAGWLIVPAFLGGTPTAGRAEDIPEADFICRETKEVFRLQATADVLPNPKTGRPTLVPAVYDERRKTWKQGPSLAARQRLRQRPAAGR